MSGRVPIPGSRRITRDLRRALRFVLAGLREHWRSVVGFAGLMMFLTALLFFLGSIGIVRLDVMERQWGSFGDPAFLSLLLSTSAYGCGFLVAIPLGWLRATGSRYFHRGRRIGVAVPAGGRKGLAAFAYGGVTGFVEVLRGTPIFVQAFIWFYLMIAVAPRLWQVFTIAGFLTLFVNTSAYQSEVFRAGIQSVGQGQVDAARALGMKPRQIFLSVTLAQSLRLVVLPLTNEWIALFKASSVLGYIAVPELYSRALDIGARFPIEGFVMVGLVYLAIIVPISRVITYVERKRRIPGLGTPIDIRRTRRTARPSTAG